jgi:HlyD family secretion protein
METNHAPAGRKNLRRWIVRGSVALVAVALVVYVSLPRPQPVAAIALQRGTMRVELDGEGRTRLRDQFTVSAPITGELERITLRVGDRVRRGDVVARLHTPARDPAQLEELRRRIEGAEEGRRQALEAVSAAETTLRAERRERARLDLLGETGAVAQQTLDLASDRVALAERERATMRHRVDAAEAEIAALRASIVPSEGLDARTLVLRAPSDGTIMRIVEPSRRTVLAGAPLVVLGDPERIEVVIDLLSSDAVRVTPGDRVRVDGWGGDPLEARVRHVAPVGVTKVSALGIEEQRVDVVADLLGTTARLGDGYRVDASIVIWERRDVVMAPTSALFRTGSDWSLFVVRDGRAVRTNVRIGQRTPFEAEVLEGVRAGDVVIPFPSDRIEDGSRVEIVDDAS